MIFKDSDLDQTLEQYKFIQLAFMTSYGADVIKSRYKENHYYDCTHLFTCITPKELNKEVIIRILNDNHNILDINELYDYWIQHEHKKYADVTWMFYNFFEKILAEITTKLVIISHKRMAIDSHKFSSNLLDTSLFCDFLDLFIYPVHQENKLFFDDVNEYCKYLDYMICTGEMVENFNVSTVEYMKDPDIGNRVHRIEY